MKQSMTHMLDTGRLHKSREGKSLVVITSNKLHNTLHNKIYVLKFQLSFKSVFFIYGEVGSKEKFVFT
jgi:hypothetical protein